MTKNAYGFTVTVAIVDFVGSATEVAFTVIVCFAVTVGAVYRPTVLILPRLVPVPLNDQVTAVLLVPVRAAVNCCVFALVNVAVAGVTVTFTGTNVIVALADFVGSASEVAVTVTVC